MHSVASRWDGTDLQLFYRVFGSGIYYVLGTWLVSLSLIGLLKFWGWRPRRCWHVKRAGLSHIYIKPLVQGGARHFSILGSGGWYDCGGGRLVGKGWMVDLCSRRTLYLWTFLELSLDGRYATYLTCVTNFLTHFVTKEWKRNINYL